MNSEEFITAFCKSKEVSDKEKHEFGLWAAEQVRHLMKDPRSIAALDAKRKWLDGEISDEELKKARDAAWDAAWDVARDTARHSTRAAWDAAGTAGRDAAWDARDAAWDAAWAAAGTAAREKQVQWIFTGMIQQHALNSSKFSTLHAYDVKVRSNWQFQV